MSISLREKYIDWLTPVRADGNIVKLTAMEAKEIQDWLKAQVDRDEFCENCGQSTAKDC